jgi:hypothetical protein
MDAGNIETAQTKLVFQPFHPALGRLKYKSFFCVWV